MTNTVTVFSKSIFSSKTFWINFSAIFLLILEAAIQVNLPIVGSQYFVFLLLVVNIINRFLTKQPVTISGGDEITVVDKK